MEGGVRTPWEPVRRPAQTAELSVHLPPLPYALALAPTAIVGLIILMPRLSCVGPSQVQLSQHRGLDY